MKRMRRPKEVLESGPYKVSSLANGQLKVTPTWGQYRPWTPEEGGGPGLGGRLALAHYLEKWLNAPYSAEHVSEALRATESVTEGVSDD